MDLQVDDQDFGARFRSTRDGALTPQDSWKKRQGMRLMGKTFPVTSPVSLEYLSVEQLQKMLLDSAIDPESTDIQIYFTQKSKIVSQEVVDRLMIKLNLSGFLTLAITVKINESGIGWMRMHLFSEFDIPHMPEDGELPLEIVHLISAVKLA